jgi:hypothetical protein
MELEKNNPPSGEVQSIIARPVPSKPKTLRNILDDDDSQQVEVVVSKKPARKVKSSKKRMQLDSDESEHEWEASDSS